MRLAPPPTAAAVSLSCFITSMLSFSRSVFDPKINKSSSPGMTAGASRIVTGTHGVMMVAVSEHVCRSIDTARPSASTT